MSQIYSVIQSSDGGWHSKSIYIQQPWGMDRCFGGWLPSWLDGWMDEWVDWFVEVE